jgi:hypothetical protein
VVPVVVETDHQPLTIIMRAPSAHQVREMLVETVNPARSGQLVVVVVPVPLVELAQEITQVTAVLG